MIQMTYDIEHIVDVNDWPKRRRAILSLLDNPFLIRSGDSYVKDLSKNLITLLKQNNHPICAYAIQLRLSGVRMPFDDIVNRLV